KTYLAVRRQAPGSPARQPRWGGRSATPLWIRRYRNAKKSKAPSLSAHNFARSPSVKTFSAACQDAEGVHYPSDLSRDHSISTWIPCSSVGKKLRRSKSRIEGLKLST